MNPWIAYHSPNPNAKVRLFCFPYAGGGASAYRDWAAGLSRDVEVLPVQLPGREGRAADPPFKHIRPLVKTIAQEILPLLNKPFAFFGHSLGGRIGFEVARELYTSHGLLPCHLFVSACNPPHLPRDEGTLHDLPHEKLVQKLCWLGGTPERIMKHERLLRRVLPSIRADFEIHDTYHYSPGPPIGCPITALVGAEDKVVSPENIYSWDRYTNSGFYLETLPGDHFFISSSRRLVLGIISEDLARTQSFQRGVQRQACLEVGALSSSTKLSTPALGTRASWAYLEAQDSRFSRRRFLK